VRFSHLASTDVPSVFWASLAVLWAIRATQSQQGRDLLVAGAFCGLAAATKYPAGLSAIAVLVAAFHARSLPGLQRALFPAILCSAAAFSVASPFVLLDAQKAIVDITVMAREHGMENLHTTDTFSLYHLLTHNLRYGLGLGTCLAVAVGLVWKPTQMTPSERVFVATILAFALFAAVSSSVFMLYAVPLAPFLSVLAIRGLAIRWVDRRSSRSCLGLSIGLVLLMLVEPTHASWKTHALLQSQDSRIEARRAI